MLSTFIFPKILKVISNRLISKFSPEKSNLENNYNWMNFRMPFLSSLLELILKRAIFSKLLVQQRLHLCSSFECRFWFYSFDEPEAVWAQSTYKKQYGETSLCYNKVQDACDNLNHVGYSSWDQFIIFHISKRHHLEWW